MPIPERKTTFKVGDAEVQKEDFGHYTARKPDRIYDFKLVAPGEEKPWRVVEAEADTGRVLKVDEASSLNSALMTLEGPERPSPPDA